MSPHRVPAAALLLAAVACSKTPAPGPAKPSATPVAAAHEAAEELHGRWQIAPLEVVLELPPGQEVSGLDARELEQGVAQTLRGMPQVLAVQPTATEYLGPDQAGMQVQVAWQLLDAEQKPLAMAAPATAGGLAMVLTVHVEQAKTRGKGEVAQHVVRLTLPFSAERHEQMAAFVMNRVAQSVEVAAEHALGELWGRGLEDARIVALLDDEVDWRRVAATREVGERRLVAATPQVEKLARSSRREVALVAVATLGRLAQVRSVPVLQACADARHLDVVESALQALLDMPGAEAQAALKQIAEDHAEDVVGQRVRALLQARP